MIIVRFFKIVLGILLLPACVGVSIVVGRDILVALPGEIWFFSGLFSYLLLLAIFQQPVRTYIFGHELTHVIWVWLFGGKVSGFKAAAEGGQVRVSKSNFLIFLAPYFFPIYCLLAILIYFLLTLVINLPPWTMPVLSFILGFSWAFHLTFTIYVLLQGQPDIWATGRVFSIPFIYLANLLVLASLIIFVAGQMTYPEFFGRVWRRVENDYRYLWTAGPSIVSGQISVCREKIIELTGE
mgnify:CR=1 FL=1